jgi:hypothetical protein
MSSYQKEKNEAIRSYKRLHRILVRSLLKIGKIRFEEDTRDGKSNSFVKNIKATELCSDTSKKWSSNISDEGPDDIECRFEKG